MLPAGIQMQDFWQCLALSDQIRALEVCIIDYSLKRSKDVRTYLAEAQIWLTGRKFTYHLSISSTCVRSGRWRAGLLSAGSNLNTQSLLSQEFPECGQEHQFRERRWKKVPLWRGHVLRLFPMGGGGLILFQGVHLPLATDKLDPSQRLCFCDMANPVPCLNQHSHVPESTNSCSAH